jgi:hypothetical protein
VARTLGVGHDRLVSLERLTRVQAVLLLAALAVLVLWGLGAGLPAGLSHLGPEPPGGDHRLYADLIRDVHGGASYYAAAPEELRRGGFPVRPVFAVRPPLLTVALARLPSEAWRHGALLALAGATWLAWARRLWLAYRREPLRLAGALVFLSSGVGLVLPPIACLFHEVWAGLLIALSLAVRGQRRWILSVGLGLAAALIRELSFPYLGVMALFAWRDRRRGEAAAWVVAFALALAALAQHAVAVAAVTRATDHASPSWAAFGGYPFILHMAKWNLVLNAAPLWVAALVLPPALLGLLFWSGAGAGRGARAGFTVLGYALGFCFVGTPNNDYWGLMIAPLWPLGLTEADRVVSGLVGRSRSRASTAATPSRVTTAVSL